MRVLLLSIATLLFAGSATANWDIERTPHIFLMCVNSKDSQALVLGIDHKWPVEKGEPEFALRVDDNPTHYFSGMSSMDLPMYPLAMFNQFGSAEGRQIVQELIDGKSIIASIVETNNIVAKSTLIGFTNAAREVLKECGLDIDNLPEFDQTKFLSAYQQHAEANN